MKRSGSFEYRVGCVEVKRLSPEETEDITRQIVAAHEVLVGVPSKYYDSSNACMKRFWEDCRSGSILPCLADEELDAVRVILKLEPVVLSSTALMIAEIARKYYRAGGALDFDDLFQEGSMLLGYCLCLYDGSSELTTYVGTSIRKHLGNLVRHYHGISNVDPKILQRKKAVSKLMSEGKTFDEAVESLELSRTKTKSLLRAMAEVKAIGSSEDTSQKKLEMIAVTLPPPDAPTAEEDMQMWEAVELADLSDFERDLLMTHLHGGTQTDVAARHISPRTGKPYTRAAAGLALDRAKKKLREAYFARQAA